MVVPANLDELLEGNVYPGSPESSRRKVLEGCGL
jgi:hypothetical protein